MVMTNSFHPSGGYARRSFFFAFILAMTVIFSIQTLAQSLAQAPLPAAAGVSEINDLDTEITVKAELAAPTAPTTDELTDLDVPNANPAFPKPTYPNHVTVLANCARVPISFWLIEKSGAREAHTLRPGETMATPHSEGLEIVFQRKTAVSRKLLLPDGIQAFSDHENDLGLYVLGPDYLREVKPNVGAVPAPEKPTSPASASQSGHLMGIPEKPRVLVIPVRILYDDKVTVAEAVWQRRVRARINAASDILERTCLVRLHIVDVGTWKSDDEAENIRDLLRDFQKKVQVSPATLAIGFTAHQNFGKDGKTELGVAGHPFFPYILLREAAPQTTEVERLETLLHELGHYLGAAHSSDENSIMRTVMKDRRGRLADFVITFDPLNTLAMNLWIRQYHRRKGPFPPNQVDDDLRKKLVSVYHLFQKAAKMQADADYKEVQVNPNVEFMLALLGEKNALVEAGLAQDSEQNDAISKVAENAYDPEDPLGLLENQKHQENAAAQTLPSNTGLDTDSLIKELERMERDGPSVASTPLPGTQTNAPPVEDPNDLLGIRRLQNANGAKPKVETPPVDDLTAIVEQNMKFPTAEKKTETPVAGESRWTPEKVEGFQMPVRTTQHILTSTLMALLQEKELPAVVRSEFKDDFFTESIIRYAADAALQVGGDKPANTPEGKVARQAFLLSLGILLEPSELLQGLQYYGKRFRALETPVITRIRRANVERVSALGRFDLCQHFSVSVALAAHIAPAQAEELGLSKEFQDAAPGGSGFDITDLNADLAGVAFSVAVQEGRVPLEKIVKGFRFVDYIPTKIDMPQELKKPQNHKQAEETMRILRDAIKAQKAYQ